MSHTFWTPARVADALAERLVTPGPSDGRALRAVSTDTRAIQAGDCFVALAGDRFDAHDFLEQAVAAGAGALVVSRPPKIDTVGIPVFVVDDTLKALGALARYWRRAWGKPVVAIAGSNGKTTTKELVRAALASVYEVHATSGNFNNRIGAPLTVLAIPPHADLAVIEVGTSEPGEIAALRAIVEPDVAVMTWIAEEHLERLGDLDGVLREEADIFDGVRVAITPSAQPMVAEAAAGRAVTVVQAGVEDGDVVADRWSIDAEGRGTIVIEGVTVALPLRGMHNVRNAMLALAAARTCGLSYEDAARGIAHVVVPPMRAAWHSIGRATVINDAYNANPASMCAALDLLGTVRGTQRVAVLGTMRELGPDAARYHDDVARAALASPADLIAGMGEMADALRRVAGPDGRVVTAPDVDELWVALAPRLAADATILLKASRGVRLERLVPHITTWAAA